MCSQFMNNEMDQLNDESEKWTEKGRRVRESANEEEVGHERWKMV